MSTEQVKNEPLNTEGMDSNKSLMAMGILQLAYNLAGNHVLYDDCRRSAKTNYNKNDRHNGMEWTPEQELRMTGVELGVKAALMYEGMVLGVEYAMAKIEEIVKKAMEEEQSKLIVPKAKIITP